MVLENIGKGPARLLEVKLIYRDSKSVDILQQPGWIIGAGKTYELETREIIKYIDDEHDSEVSISITFEQINGLKNFLVFTHGILTDDHATFRSYRFTSINNAFNYCKDRRSKM